MSSPPATWNFINWYPFSKEVAKKKFLVIVEIIFFLNKAQCVIILVVEKEEKTFCKSLEVIQTQNHIYINILRFKRKMIMLSHYLLKKKKNVTSGLKSMKHMYVYILFRKILCIRKNN